MASQITYISRLFVQQLVHASIKHQSSALLALCERNPLGAGRFPSQKVSDEKSVSESWRHHNLWMKN